MTILGSLLIAANTLDVKTELDGLLEAMECNGDEISITETQRVRSNIGVLPEIAAFGSADEQLAAHRLAWNIAKASGIFPASIDMFYRKMSRGEIDGLTVPAMNMRAIAYVSARGVFQAMQKHNVGATIFELSRGEIGFTAQRPHEYATAILSAAIAEQHHGPLFLQGDHFQVSASRYAADARAEMDAVKALITEAVSAGFYNIDIDCSTLVDLAPESVAEQQKLNIDLTTELVRHSRTIQPSGVILSLGGEIGEVGDKNSTVEEVDVYLTGVSKSLGPDIPGLSKLSIQSGTRHGGNVLPDGSFGDMNVDFTLIGELTAACRECGEVAGCVQHGASMLSLEKIARLPVAGCIEVHLAAAFLNAVYENLPNDLVTQADAWVKEEFAHEWKADWSEAQFLHHARRYPIGPNKRAWWGATQCHDAVLNAVSQRAGDYIRALKVYDTSALIAKTITHAPQNWQGPHKDLAPAVDERLIRDLAD